MHYNVTVTLKQLSALRLMLRLQKIKVIRLGLQKYRAGTIAEHVALYEILERGDKIQDLDLMLMFAEHTAMAHQLTQRDVNLLVPVNLTISESHLSTSREAADRIYSADSSLGDQHEQALILQVLASEREGIKLALATANPYDQVAPPIFQAQPQGQQ